MTDRRNQFFCPAVFMAEERGLTLDQAARILETEPEILLTHLRELIVSGEVQSQKERLDAPTFLALALRIDSPAGIPFQNWGRELISHFVRKGYVLDVVRLRDEGDPWEFLLEEVMEVKRSSRTSAQRITDLYATAVDYDPRSQTTRIFWNQVRRCSQEISPVVLERCLDHAEACAYQRIPITMAAWLKFLDEAINLDTLLKKLDCVDSRFLS